MSDTMKDGTPIAERGHDGLTSEERIKEMMLPILLDWGHICTATLEAELAEANLYAATLKAERDALNREIELLAEAIVLIGVETGITDGMLPLDGPRILLIASGIKADVSTLKAKVARLEAPVSDCGMGHIRFANRFNAIIAARAKEQP